MSPKKEATKKDEKSNVFSAKKKENQVPSEAEVDLGLVEEAYGKLEGIVSKHITMAMLEAGQYIVEKFYDDNYDNARNNKKVKIKSLTELVKKLQGTGNAPRKTWIYDAVKLAVDDYDYKDFSAYGKIGHSHKVTLTHVKEGELKKKLIQETADRSYNVEKLKERIKALKGDVTLSDSPSEKELRKLEAKDLQKLKSYINWRVPKMEEKLDEYKNYQDMVTKILKDKGEDVEEKPAK